MVCKSLSYKNDNLQFFTSLTGNKGLGGGNRSVMYKNTAEQKKLG